MSSLQRLVLWWNRQGTLCLAAFQYRMGALLTVAHLRVVLLRVRVVTCTIHFTAPCSGSLGRSNEMGQTIEASKLSVVESACWPIFGA